MTPLTKHNLVGSMRALTKINNPIDRRDVLINLLLTYINDNDILSIMWEIGMDAPLSKTLINVINESKNKTPNKLS